MHVSHSSGLIAAVLSPLLSGCALRLPPREDLERGCHVWWGREGGDGVVASVSGTRATIQGGLDMDGPTLAGDTIQLLGEDVGRFRDRVLTLKAAGRQPEYSGKVGPRPVGSVTLAGASGTAMKFEVSVACSPSEAALGAAAVYIVLSDWREEPWGAVPEPGRRPPPF